MRISTLILLFFAYAANSLPIDRERYSAASGVTAEILDQRIILQWPTDDATGQKLILNLAEPEALIESLGTPDPVIRNSSPVFLVTVGTRDLDPRRGWIRFFDRVNRKPYQQYRARLNVTGARISSDGRSTTIAIDGLTAGSFSGHLQFTVYPGSRLVHIEAVLTTKEDARAFVYDAGIVSNDPNWRQTVYVDSQDKRQTLVPKANSSNLAVRHRTVIAKTRTGAVAVFPPPHQYFYPLDFADNFRFTWQGTGYRNLVPESGLGIRQPLDGDNRYVPWFNAPPETAQRLGFFLLPTGSDHAALREAKRYTRDDKFKRLPGYQTFTSHYHVEHSLDLIEKQAGRTGIPGGLENPGFKQVFKRMGVDIVHLAEFHRGRTPRLKTAERLHQLKVMHDECKRLSEPGFLLLPGEEPNVHLGGHWISFFPKPINWVLNRGKNKPFVEQHPEFGKVYHVGNRQDVLKLFELENGLNWTAHARIKGSTGYPDLYRTSDFFQSDRFLGAAWKSMPADLSHDRLGERVLNLLDNMANWGRPKYVLGEVDVFKIQPDYELWGHMNINYLKLDKVPRYQDGWQPVLDVLRQGAFFVTTGEVLLPWFNINGCEAGGTLILDDTPFVTITAQAEWTFPPAFAIIVSGDGKTIHQNRISLRDRPAFGKTNLEIRQVVKGRKWARLELWDIAGNGAFTQPVWFRDN